MIATGNLFARPLETAATPSGEEHFEELLARPGLVLERIVSHGQVSPPGFWFDQPRDEWVVLLSGAARLTLEGESTRPRRSARGTGLLLPAHRRHRVEWTDPERGRPAGWRCTSIHAGFHAGCRETARGIRSPERR